MGPLQGIKVIEIAGLGPGPFCAMLLADMGAEVIRIERKDATPLLGFIDPEKDVFNRGKRSVALDLKNPAAVVAVLDLCAKADALIEGFRPGVMERLGLGPDICLQRNPKLVYARMTGWGQQGPLAQAAGHDINYIALSGALYAIGQADAPPPPPLNLVGDFGGGAMLLAFGLVCGLLEAGKSGQGQVIDAAMTDGSALLMTMVYSLKNMGQWRNQRAANFLDGAAHFYGCYECADAKYIAIAPIESQFYQSFLALCDIDDEVFTAQWDSKHWPELKAKLTELFKRKTRAEWCSLLEGSDVCFAPVLDLDEAPQHAHNRARQTFVEHNGFTQPAPAPRFSRTQAEIGGAPPAPGEHTETVLAEWGCSAARIAELRAQGAI